MRPVYFVVLPNIMLLDLAGAAEALRLANAYCKDASGAQQNAFDLQFVGPDAQCPSSVGLTLGGIATLPDDLPPGALIVLSGTRKSLVDYESESTTRLVEWLGSRVRAHHLLCTVCSGALLAARAGLLDGRRCTTHHDICARLAKEYPRVQVQENRIFVRDGNIMTSAGITTGIDLALHLIAELATPVQSAAAIAAQVAREMVVYTRRAGNDPQLSPWLDHRNHLHPIVHRAQDAILRNPANGWTLASIADVAHTSSRNLSRLFREQAGISVLDYLQHIRIAAARERIATTNWPLERVAESAGFSSAHQLRRIWRKLEGETPSLLRQH